jgi:hypothetical protein
MSFVYPWFLWALLVLIIPIIIHLFHFRRFKTVYFTNVRFLKEVKEQTSARSKVKHLLVLLSRMLALAALVLAFAMPYIPSEGGNIKAGSKDVSIYFDNSFSMAAESEDVRLLEKARIRVEEIVSAYSTEDKIQIITTDFEGRDQRLLSKEDALTRLGEVQITHNVQPLSKVLLRQKQALSTGKNKNKEVYMVSDFQKNITDLEVYKDTSVNLTLVPLQSVQSQNIAIDTAWFQSPVQSLNQPNPLVVKIRNLSDTEIPNVRMSLAIKGQTRPIGTLTIPAQTAIYDTIDVPVLETGWHEAKITITDFPIEFDNDYYFAFNVDEQVDILQIHGGTPNRYVQATFEDNDYFKATMQSVGKLDFSKFSTYDLIILDELVNLPSGLISELHGYAKNGGNVVVFPHPSAQLADYKNLTRLFNANSYATIEKKERKVSFINFEEFIFNDVFEERRGNIKLPVTQSNFKIQKRATSGEEVILRYRDGNTFVGKYRVEKGHLFLCAAPLGVDYSNFVTENGEIFVPMLYKMALSTTNTAKIAYTIGKDDVLESDSRPSDSEVMYKLKGGQEEFIPQQRVLGSRVMLGLENQIKRAGFYDLYFSSKDVLDKFAYNYDRKESYLSFYAPDELGQLVGSGAAIVEGTNTRDFADTITTQSKGTPLWKWCLILALIFLLLETVLLRLWKV